MPKMKTHSGAKKRFKKTANGLIKFKKSGSRHLNAKKGKSRLRRLHESAYISAGKQRRLDRTMPYSM